MTMIWIHLGTQNFPRIIHQSEALKRPSGLARLLIVEACAITSVKFYLRLSTVAEQGTNIVLTPYCLKQQTNELMCECILN